MEHPDAVRRGRARTSVARVVAGVLVLFWAGLFFGVQDFLTPLVEGQSFALHYLLETGWGLTFLVLVGVPLVVLVVRPGAVVALQQLVVVAAALAVGALLAASPRHLLPVAGLLVSATLLLLLAGGDLRVPFGRPAPVSAALSAVGLLAVLPYTWEMAHGSALPEYTVGLDHYPVQAGFAVAVVLVGALAAVTTARCSGARWLPAATASFAAGWFGVLCVVWPHRLGSLGTAGGVAAGVWALALLAAVAIEGRA